MGEKFYKCFYCDYRVFQKGNFKIYICSYWIGILIQGYELEVGEVQLGEMCVFEGLDGCVSFIKSIFVCNCVLNGVVLMDGSKILFRSSCKEVEGVVSVQEDIEVMVLCFFCKSWFECKKDLELYVYQVYKLFKCRLCSYVILWEEFLFSYIERDYIIVQVFNGSEVCVENGKFELSFGEFFCEVCGQVFSQIWFLKVYMKKYWGFFDYGCYICGWRFKEFWFFKNYMKVYGFKVGSKNRFKSELDFIVIINNVVQEEVIVVGLFFYEVCIKCGNLFINLDSLNVYNVIYCKVEVSWI